MRRPLAFARRRPLAALGVVAFAVVVLLGAGRAEARQIGATPAPPSPAATAAPPPAASPAPSPTAPPGIQPGPGAPGVPNPTPTAPPASVNAPGTSSPGFFDVAGHIEQAIDNWFRDLVTSALNPVLQLLGRTVFATPNVAGPGRVSDLWGLAAGIGNAALVLLVLAGGAVVMSHETLQTRGTRPRTSPPASWSLRSRRTRASSSSPRPRTSPTPSPPPCSARASPPRAGPR